MSRMSSRTGCWSALIGLAILATTTTGCSKPEPLKLSVEGEFRRAIDLEPIRHAAVLDDGRIKTFETLAREKIKLVNASPEARAVDAPLLFLDLLLAPEYHHHAPTVFIRKQVFRRAFIRQVRALVPAQQRQGELSEANLQAIEERGFCTVAFLDQPPVREALTLLERDLMGAARDAQALETARAYADPGTLLGTWRVIPPPGGTPLSPWYSLGALLGSGADQGMPDDSTHSAVREAGRGIPGLTPAISETIRGAWADLGRAWRFQDASAANKALATLATSFRAAEPSLYPESSRLSWETWYYRTYKMTWVWIIYLAALPFLLLAVVYKVGWARGVGIGFFTTGFALHSFATILRWYLAGRIPNANMFEAITMSAWLGGAVALVLELILRRFPLKNLPALAASTYAMFAMMVGYFQPVVLGAAPIDNDITTVMPVLDRTIWLYIHTNMVIASYALIFFGSVTAVIYLVLHYVALLTPAKSLRAAFAGADGLVNAPFGGAASLIMGRGGLNSANIGLGKTLDGATMIFLELAFLTLLVGTILGAVWADVSWGRPWGWDPKEVFALNTWLVFLVLVHVRIKVKEKAFWTAWLAVLGCAVMLFNWLAVNFRIVGLHSYA